MALTHPEPTRPTPTARRAPPASRRLGYTIAILVNLALVYVVNVWPGWQAVSWLTSQTADVLGLVNMSLVASVVVNVFYLAYDAPWFKSLGDLVTTAIGFAAVASVYAVFPFDFSAYSMDWGFIARIVLVAAAVGAAIGVAVNLVQLVVRAIRAAGHAATSA